MAWIVLLGSAFLEAVWATALSYSEGFSNLLPTLVFLVATTVSMVGLAYAVKTIPLGTAYSIWTGLGAAMTAAYSMIMGMETITGWKVFFLAMIVFSAVGLKALSGGQREASASSGA